MRVDQIDRAGEVRHPHHRKHRPEDLFAVDLHLRRHLIEQRAADKETLLMARHTMAASVHHQLGPGPHPFVDIARHLGQVRCRHQRPHLRIRCHPVLDLQCPYPRDQLFDQRVGHLPHRHRHRDRHAALAGRPVGCAHQRIDGLLQIRIRHHHQMVLGPAQRLHPLAARRPLRIDVFGNRGRTDKGQRRHVRVLDQRIDRFLVAVHHIEHSIRQAGFLQQFGQPQWHRGIALGRLEYEGVAAGERDREHPARHHHRKIERRHPGHHPQGLAHAPVVDPAADLLGVLALEQMRNAAGELDHFNAARDFAQRIGEHLAVFARDQRGQLFLVRVEQLLELEQDAGALKRRGLAPWHERGLGGRDRESDVGLRGQRHACRHRALRRVVHLAVTLAAAGGRTAAYHVRQNRDIRLAHIDSLRIDGRMHDPAWLPAHDGAGPIARKPVYRVATNSTLARSIWVRENPWSRVKVLPVTEYGAAQRTSQ